ncbi:hypothetical protein A6V39_01005 [Candidatus Mycoplasma haematobovis]|uniref:Uncharacterized protein n=1 Tax=Candidatus Mycoplasma haematobovis TaxID=432608 RepID=A0A1A9QF44_9MOLU|nr:hypothetical protein [Candidatus Mycoplasma haematobovis]OAL10631.1 hypothetical protein A6V39_01005 [Candidatus Mycoplasma haematobovis]
MLLLRSWVSSLHFKFAILFSISTLTALGSALSIKSNKEEVKKVYVGVNTPEIGEVFEGTKKIGENLSTWTKSIANNSKEVINNWEGGSVPDGAKILFNKLNTWAESVYESLKEATILLQKEWDSLEKIKSSIKNSDLLLRLFGSNSIFAKLFEVTSNGNLLEFLKSLRVLFSNSFDLWSSLNANEMGHIFDSYASDPEGTSRVLKEIGNKNGATKQELLNKLKIANLKNKVNGLMVRAQEILKNKDKEAAKKAIQELTELKKEIDELIKKKS